MGYSSARKKQMHQCYMLICISIDCFCVVTGKLGWMGMEGGGGGRTGRIKNGRGRDKSAEVVWLKTAARDGNWLAGRQHLLAAAEAKVCYC